MHHFLKRKLAGSILIIAAIAGIAVFADLTGLFDILERKTVDLRTKLSRDDKTLPSDIALILIDESSLQALNEIVGRWPWPRYIHADLIDFLSQIGAREVVMDILFTENEFAPSLNTKTLSNNDFRFIQSTRSAKTVYHAAQLIADEMDEYNRSLLNKPLPPKFINRFSTDVEVKGDAVEHNSYYLPFKGLYEASRGIGIVSFLPDSDGVFRSEKLLFKYQDNFFPALSLAPIINRLGYKKIVLNKGSMEIKNNGSLIRIPLTENNEYFVNMYGLYDAFSISGVILSMLKIKHGEIDNLPIQPDAFRDKIVFIGASAAGVEDLKNTSIGPNTPGVFLHASICGNIISKDFLKFSGPGANFLWVLILLTITVLSIFYLKTVLLQMFSPLIAMILFSSTALVLFNSNIVIKIISPWFSVVSAYVASFTYKSFTEGREKRKIRNILGQYVSPAILTNVLKKNQDGYLKAEVGSKETLTIFFSDIRGFTTISEKYNVEEVVEILNTYLSSMVSIIFSNQGTLDKFIGDAIVAFWGAPIRIHDHHYKAVLTGLQMKEALKTYNHENVAKGLPELRVGIGIHTGEVILGNIGSEKKLDYTVIGDSVNLASRLENLTKAYKTSIIISQNTYDHVQNEIFCRMADYIKVKGKDQPIRIYEALGEAGSVDKETVKIAHLTERAFEQYLERKFSEATDTYESILAVRPGDFLSKMFIDRCRNFQQNEPPEDWNGCHVYSGKFS